MRFLLLTDRKDCLLEGELNFHIGVVERPGYDGFFFREVVVQELFYLSQLSLGQLFLAVANPGELLDFPLRNHLLLLPLLYLVPNDVGQLWGLYSLQDVLEPGSVACLKIHVLIQILNVQDLELFHEGCLRLLVYRLAVALSDELLVVLQSL